MFSFKNDYSEGAHPQILEKLIETNLAQQDGYGEDEFSIQARRIIQDKIQNPNASIYFVSGGTQANLLVISALLNVHEAVICAQTGHIFIHETGAIEAVGHRVITVPTSDGKLTPALVSEGLKFYENQRPHMVKPKMVYISNATEIGTVYTKNELTALYEYCQAQNLFLFLDGARLGNALTADGNDLHLPDLAKLTDVFYIGGTKNGALLGEAIIFNDNALMPEFDYIIKQKGAMMAKGRILGIQFLELFKNDLYYSLAQHANLMAQKLAAALEEYGFTFLTVSKTNQIFPILPNDMISTLRKSFQFYDWESVSDTQTCIRLVTSWATSETAVDEFIKEISKLK